MDKQEVIKLLRQAGFTVAEGVDYPWLNMQLNFVSLLIDNIKGAKTS